MKYGMFPRTEAKKLQEAQFIARFDGSKQQEGQKRHSRCDRLRQNINFTL
jgi:hypothetical protein